MSIFGFEIKRFYLSFASFKPLRFRMRAKTALREAPVNKKHVIPQVLRR